MRKDDHLIYEAFQDNLTKTKQALGQNIMRMVKHGVPSNEDLPAIKQELTNIFSAAKKANNKFTPEQEETAKELIAKLRNSGMPEDELRNIYRNAPVDNRNTQDYAKDMEKDYTSQKIGSEAAEDMSKSPFHYDPMHGLASAAHKIRGELRSAANDEARPEHIEKMAEIILGPQSEYASVDHYEKALSGVIELLNHYVVVSMNEYEEMPEKDFNKLKQHINKGPIKLKTPSKELSYTHKYIHHLAKKDSREEHKEEDAESACIEDLARKHGVSLEDITHQLEMGLKVEMEHTEDMNIAKKIALDHLAEDPHYYTKLSKMEGKGENAENRVYNDVEVAFNINGREYIAYGDVHFGEEGLHGKEEDTVENFVVLDAQTRQEVKDEAVLKHGYNAVYNAGVNQSAEENGEDDGELMTHMKQAGMIPKGSKPTVGPHTTRERRSENEERRLDPKCWKGYHKQGTKLKDGKRVNNCVKNS